MMRLNRTTFTSLLALLALVLLSACGGSRASRLDLQPEVLGGLGEDGGTDAGLPRWVSAAKAKKPIAVPGAFPTLGQAPKKVKLFDNGSFSPNGPIIKWEWNFGDAPGGWHDYTSTHGLAYHTYSSPGTYQAQLRVSDSQSPPVGQEKITITITTSGNLNPVAQAHATPLFGTAPLAVAFDAAGSYDPDGFLISWEWDLLGNGTFADYTLTEGVANFTYIAGGIYHPIVRVTDDNGAVAESSLTVYVNAVPDASATATPDFGYPPMAVSFDGSSSSDPDGAIVKYEWDFGEGGGWVDYDGLPTASHTYYSAGNYTAQLRVTDNAGATAIAALSVDTTQPPPNVPPLAAGTVAPQFGTNPLTVHFDGSSSSDSDGQLVSWEWDLADGSGFHDYSAAQGVLDFTYINAGNFVAVLRVTDDDGDSDTESFPIHVNAHPTAQGHVLPDSGSAPLQCAFDAIGSADSDGNIVQWHWDFGEGAGFEDFTSTQGAASHTYNSAGNFSAKLLVTDNEGGQDVLILSIGVTASPVGGTGAGVWPMYGHDAQRTRRSPLAGPATNVLKWSLYTGNTVYSSPSIGANGTVYVGNHAGNVYAIDPSDGHVLPGWPFTTGGWIVASPAVYVDPDTAEETVYVGSFLRESMFYALDPSNPAVPRWTCPMEYQGVYSSPVIGANGMVYVGSFHRLYAFDPAKPHPGGNMAPAWTFLTGGAVYSSPAVSTDGSTVFVGSDDNTLYAIDAVTGTEKWRYTPPIEGNPEYPSGGFESSAAVYFDPGTHTETVYAGNLNGFLYALNENGSLKWSYNTGRYVYSSPSVGSNGAVYVGCTNNKLLAVDKNGSLMWEFATGNRIQSSPAIDKDGMIYVGCWDRKVYAIDPANPSVPKWTYTTGSYVDSSPTIGAGGMLYVGSEDGYVYAIGTGETAGWNWGAPQTVDAANDVGGVTSMFVVNRCPAISYPIVKDDKSGAVNYARAADPSGSVWGEPLTVDPGIGVPGTVVSETVLRMVNGNPVICYVLIGDDKSGAVNIARASDPNGSAWGAPQTLDTGVDIGSISMAAANGFPAICYKKAVVIRDVESRALVYLQAADLNGSAWGAPQILDTSAAIGSISMAAANGFPAICYKKAVVVRDVESRAVVYLRASDPDGSAWGAPQILATGFDFGGISMAAANGFPAICYTAIADDKSGVLNFARATDPNGSSWGAPQILDAAALGLGLYTNLLVAGGCPVISYDCRTAAGGAALKFIAASNANGSAWGAPQTLDSSAGGEVGMGNSLAVLNDGLAISYSKKDERGKSNLKTVKGSKSNSDN